MQPTSQQNDFSSSQSAKRGSPSHPDEEARAKVVMFCSSFLVDLQAELVFYHWRRETSTRVVHKHFRDINLLRI